VTAGIEIASALQTLFPGQWKIDDYIKLLANSDTLARLKKNETTDSVIRSWSDGLERFRAVRAKALLY
jgi:hypothetical protein